MNPGMSDPNASAAPLSGRTAWARGLETPLRAFLRTETGSAAVLLAATIAALIWANVDASSYRTLWGTQMSISIGGLGGSPDDSPPVDHDPVTASSLIGSPLPPALP